MSITRRQFLRQSAHGAGLLALAGGSVAAATHAAAATSVANPFAYDVERFSKTDPALIHYEQVRRFVVGSPHPRRVAVGPEDRVYVACGTGVAVLTSQGERLDHLALPSPVRCLAVTPDGTVYAGLRSQVTVLDRRGKSLATWDAPGKKTWLTGLAAGENDVFAADAGNRVVLRFDRSGKPAGRIGEKDKERNVPGLIIPSPYLDVKLARDGLLRLNNPGRHRVEAYTVDGDLEFFWGKPSAGIEGFCGCCNPIGLAPLPDGRCVTCEKGLPRVKIYGAAGSFECVVAGSESFPDNAKAGAARDAADGTMGGLDAAVDAQGQILVLDLVAGDVRVMRRKAAA